MSDPSDGGDSEYNIITCVQCSAEVGKVYVRTSQETAKLQDLISLSTDAVCSYQLGRHEMRVQGTGDLNPLSEERVTRLEEQMVKVENVLVLFNERWHAMESALRQLQRTKRRLHEACTRETQLSSRVKVRRARLHPCMVNVDGKW